MEEEEEEEEEINTSSNNNTPAEAAEAKGEGPYKQKQLTQSTRVYTCEQSRSIQSS